MSNEFNTSLWTMNDPFTDSAILEEQPDGYAPESDDQRSIASSNSSGRGGDFQGTGILVPWTPGHNRRRSSQSHSSTKSPPRSSSFIFPRPSPSSPKRARQQQLALGYQTPQPTVIEEIVTADITREEQSGSYSEQTVDSASSSIQEIIPTRPQRAFPLACPNRRTSSTGHFSENSHSSQSSRNFSRPFNEMNEKKSIDSTSPVRKAYFDDSWGFNGPVIADSLDLNTEKVGSNKYTPDPSIPASRLRSSCVMVNSRKSKYTIEEEKVVRAIGKKRLRYTRNIFIVFFIIINAVCISISWTFPEYWYIFVPIILLGNVMNSLMVINIIRWFIWGLFLKLINKGPPEPATHVPSTIAMVLACYCESYQDLMDTLESLNSQEKVAHHKKMFIIICDGQVKGKGMEKSTDRILVEDILKPKEEHWFPVGYESWDGAVNGIYASAGIWEGTPYVCLVKKRNLGKRDGLILVRTLLYKYKFRHENPVTSMGDDFFRWFCEFSEDCTIEQFEWLVGVDADTTFNSTCIYEMHKECLKDPKLVGCSGLIQVGFRTGQWNLWNVYQNTEYIRAQCLRRWHQAHGTGKVSCLPGACQIIKIVEETCGDVILIKLFGQIPDPKANMILQVRALAGEDRNYICLIFQQFPEVQTTMSLNAIAFTDPPNGFMVFLSQRKRWTLSTCANDMLISFRNEMNFFERICSLADILTWLLPLFVMQTVVLFIKACINVVDPTFIACFAIVTMIPLSYGLGVAYWGCNTNLLRAQYLLGFLMVVLFGQLITPVVISYAIWHMDDFSWGKTREIEASDDPDSKPAHSD